MARISKKTKSTRGKPYTRLKCNKQIKAGEEYYEWTPFRSYSRRKHATCGYPKQSETDTSKMASVYASIEAAEETIAQATEVSDITGALDDVAQSAEDTASEYQEAVDAMGSAGESGTSAERAKALESFKDELESASSEIGADEFEKDEESEVPEEDQRTDWLTGLRDQANDVLGNLSV